MQTIEDLRQVLVAGLTEDQYVSAVLTYLKGSVAAAVVIRHAASNSPRQVYISDGNSPFEADRADVIDRRILPKLKATSESSTFSIFSAPAPPAESDGSMDSSDEAEDTNESESFLDDPPIPPINPGLVSVQMFDLDGEEILLPATLKALLEESFDPSLSVSQFDTAEVSASRDKIMQHAKTLAAVVSEQMPLSAQAGEYFHQLVIVTDGLMGELTRIAKKSAMSARKEVPPPA